MWLTLTKFVTLYILITFVHFSNFGHFGCFGHFLQNVTNSDKKWQNITTSNKMWQKVITCDKLWQKVVTLYTLITFDVTLHHLYTLVILVTLDALVTLYKIDRMWQNMTTYNKMLQKVITCHILDLHFWICVVFVWGLLCSCLV